MTLSEAVRHPHFEFDDPDWLADAIKKIEDDLYQALERESRLEFALLEAGLDMGEPWDNNG